MPFQLFSRIVECIWRQARRSDRLAASATRLLIRIATLAEPQTDEFFCHVGFLPSSQPFLRQPSAQPIAARIRRMNLVDQENLAIVRHAKLILCIHQNQPATGGNLLAECKQLECLGRSKFPLLCRQPALVDDFLWRNRPVVGRLLGGWRDDVLGQRLVLLMPSGSAWPQ